jgi:hypothetical protein
VIGDPERQPVKPFPLAELAAVAVPAAPVDPEFPVPEVGEGAVPELWPGVVWSVVELPGAVALGAVCAGWLALGVLFGVEVRGVPAGLLCV